MRLIPLTAAAAALSLGACALLSTPDPAQLYRFGTTPLPTAGAAVAAPVQVAMRRIDFTEAAAQDRILGITGTEAAYIAGARWVAPAEQLYGDALQATFAAQASRVRLVGRGERTQTSVALDVDVTVFEARYAQAGAVPTATVVARARLLDADDRTVAAEQTFTIEQTATANRVSAIVEAFDIGVRDLNSQIVSWTEANVR